MDASWMDTGSPLSARAREWGLKSRPGMRYVDIGVAELRVRDVGPPDAPAVVFAADAPVGIEHHDRVLGSWPADRRAVVMDMPGFGFSRARRGFDFSVGAFADAAGKALDALQCREPTLVFPCAWGFVALELARMRPDRVAKLVLPQTPSWDDIARWVERVDRPRVLRRPVVGQLLMKARQTSVAGQWFRVAYPDRKLGAAMHAECAETFAHGGRFPLASLMQGFERSRPPASGPLPMPVRVLWGGGDRSHRPTPPDSVKALAPNAEVEVIPTAGHSPELEHPDRLLALLVD
jgi:pimeloyl-ACP methyl ester carboxylesterase